MLTRERSVKLTCNPAARRDALGCVALYEGRALEDEDAFGSDNAVEMTTNAYDFEVYHTKTLIVVTQTDEHRD